MTKPISSYPKREQAAVISRRLAGNFGGLGYLAAKDAVDPKLMAKRPEKEAPQE
jgi:hypothetical protein